MSWNRDWLFESGPQTGWLKVDQFTLQHGDFPNVFGIGDVTGIPNSKTGAAVRKQAPVVATNLLDVMAGRPPTAKYDGYSSCPLVTAKGKVVLAEFGYDNKLMPTFPVDQTKERRSMGSKALSPSHLLLARNASGTSVMNGVIPALLAWRRHLFDSLLATTLSHFWRRPRLCL